MRARPELAAELWRRGLFSRAEKSEMLRAGPQPRSRALGPVQFATLLAEADATLAAHVVLRDLLTHDELLWLDKVLRFRPRRRTGRRFHELVRVVERALEGTKCQRAC